MCRARCRITETEWSRDTQLQAGYNSSYKRINCGDSVSRQRDVTTNYWDNHVMLNVDVPLGNWARVRARRIR